jgi:hypothetical protein
MTDGLHILLYFNMFLGNNKLIQLTTAISWEAHRQIKEKQCYRRTEKK